MEERSGRDEKGQRKNHGTREKKEINNKEGEEETWEEGKKGMKNKAGRKNHGREGRSNLNKGKER